MKKLFLLLALTVSLSLFSFQAKSQTTNAVINSVSMEFTGSSAVLTSVSIAGSTNGNPFTFNATYIYEAYYPNIIRCSPCMTGNLVQLSWNSPGDHTFGAPTTVNGVNYNMLYLSTASEGYGPWSFFKFTVADFTVPYMPFRRPLILTVPARIQARLYAFTANPVSQFPPPPVFTSDIDLQGTATIDLGPSYGGGAFGRFHPIRNITFNFTNSTINNEKQ